MNKAVTLAKPFVSATVKVLSMMANITPQPGVPYVKGASTAENGDISAIVGVTGEMCGSISIIFSRVSAEAVVRGMLGDDIDDLEADMKDTVGEITNMVSGHARAELAEKGILIHGSTPTLVVGENHSITHFSKGNVVVIPFSIPQGEFAVEFAFE